MKLFHPFVSFLLPQSRGTFFLADIHWSSYEYKANLPDGFILGQESIVLYYKYLYDYN